MSDLQPAIRVMLMPKDTNEHGVIFGGVILSHIDLACAVEARRHTRHRVTTVAIREVIFHAPVYVGDVVSFHTSLVKKGRTSMTIQVHVEALRSKNPGEVVRVTQAETVFVALDEAGRPVPVDS